MSSPEVQASRTGLVFWRALARTLVALLALVPSAGATWSIVAVNRRTGEVCIASATCIPRQDLTEWTPVLLVGRGGGVTQASLDNGENKVRIHEGLLSGQTPLEIMASIRAGDSFVNTRQFGIVDFTNEPFSFTGRAASKAKKSVAGVVGDIAYAIQGNILVHERVINECEATLAASTGDLGQRVLAAMVRARELGGDGRCSCDINDGLFGNCGMPAPDFRKSAHIGYLILARMGDVDGPCQVGEGCADGQYTLRLSIHGGNALHDDPDPVDQLVERYASWRAARRGRPDGILSRAETADSLPADGVTERTVTVRLVDLEGQPLAHGGATLELATEDGAPPHAVPGPIVDHGDGSYSLALRAGTEPGLDRFVVRARDELVSATLYPYLAVRSDPPAPLHAGRDRVSAAAPAGVPFVVAVPERPAAKFWLVARFAGGPKDGSPFDPAAFRGLIPGRAPFFPGPPGVLDGNGRAEPSYMAPAGALGGLIGLRIEWKALVFGRGLPLESNTVGFDIVP